MIASLTTELVLDAHAELGEGPVWHPREQVLYWVDITRNQVHRLDPRSGEDTVMDVGQAVGAVVPRTAGGLAVAVQDGFGLVDGDGRLTMIAPVQADDPSIRMNDGKCDSQGRFWAGTMAYDIRPGGGALYRLNPDHSVHTMLTGVTISNGLDWTDDDRTMYHIDSLDGHGTDHLSLGVDAFDFDAATGSMANRRRVAEVPNDLTAPTGFIAPDGMTLDSQGHLWVAVHGAGEVRRFDPAGTLVGVVELPVLGVTSVAFGGDDLADLYVTTNTTFPAGDARAHPNEGGIFRCRPGVRGRPANMFAG